MVVTENSEPRPKEVDQILEEGGAMLHYDGYGIVDV